MSDRETKMTILEYANRFLDADDLSSVNQVQLLSDIDQRYGNSAEQYIFLTADDCKVLARDMIIEADKTLGQIDATLNNIDQARADIAAIYSQG